MKNGIRVVTNAGGMNPQGLKEAIEKECEKQGIDGCVVACVYGDDLFPKVQALQERNALSPFAVAGQEERINTDKFLMSFNAYVGSEGVTRALDAGANVCDGVPLWAAHVSHGCWLTAVSGGGDRAVC